MEASSKDTRGACANSPLPYPHPTRTETAPRSIRALSTQPMRCMEAVISPARCQEVIENSLGTAPQSNSSTISGRGWRHGQHANGLRRVIQCEFDRTRRFRNSMAVLASLRFFPFLFLRVIQINRKRSEYGLSDRRIRHVPAARLTPQDVIQLVRGGGVRGLAQIDLRSCDSHRLARLARNRTGCARRAPALPNRRKSKVSKYHHEAKTNKGGPQIERQAVLGRGGSRTAPIAPRAMAILAIRGHGLKPVARFSAIAAQLSREGRFANRSYGTSPPPPPPFVPWPSWPCSGARAGSPWHDSPQSQRRLRGRFSNRPYASRAMAILAMPGHGLEARGTVLRNRSAIVRWGGSRTAPTHPRCAMAILAMPGHGLEGPWHGSPQSQRDCEGGSANRPHVAPRAMAILAVPGHGWKPVGTILRNRSAIVWKQGGSRTAPTTPMPWPSWPCRGTGWKPVARFSAIAAQLRGRFAKSAPPTISAHSAFKKFSRSASCCGFKPHLKSGVIKIATTSPRLRRSRCGNTAPLPPDLAVPALSHDSHPHTAL